MLRAPALRTPAGQPAAVCLRACPRPFGSLHGHYPLQSYYEDSDCCRASRDVPAPAALLCSRHSPCLTYGHQPLQQSPRQVPYLAVPVRCVMHRGFASHSQARRYVVAESCSLVLLSVRFFWLLSTPPRGDAVTSSSRPEHGSSRLESSTPEGRDASKRTGIAFQAVNGQRLPALIRTRSKAGCEAAKRTLDPQTGLEAYPP